MELQCDAGDKAATLGAPRVEASKSILVHPLIVEETITHSLLTSDVADLPKKCVELTLAFQDAARAYPNLPNKFVLGHQPEMFPREDGLIGTSLFLAGIISAAAIGTPITTLLSSWRTSVVTNPFSKDNPFHDRVLARLVPLASMKSTATDFPDPGMLDQLRELAEAEPFKPFTVTKPI
jgi:hypothetical protein